MDPISALGLAGNIIQFIDFGCKLFSKTKAIYKDGSLTESIDMQVVTDDLRQYSEKLRQGLQSSGTQQLGFSEDEKALLSMCDGCLQVAGEIDKALQALKLQSKPGKCKSFRHAIKSVWSDKRLAELKRRLDMYSEQMDRRTLASLRYAHL